MLKGLIKVVAFIFLLGFLAAVFVPKTQVVQNQKKFAPQAVQQPPSPEKIKAATKNLVVRHDKVRGTDWYEPKAFQAANSGVFLYIGNTPGSMPWLRVVFRYHGSSWVFARKILIRADDALFIITPGEWARDNYTTVWETADMMMAQKELDIVRRVIVSKQVILRFEGDDRQQDITVSASMKQDLQKVLDAYEEMGGRII